MKYFFFALFLVGLSAVSGQANDQDEALFRALSVKAKGPPEGIATSGGYESKFVGGLLCSKNTFPAPNAKPSYKCDFKEGVEVDHRAIYDSLNVEAKGPPNGIATSGAYEAKFVGGLLCAKNTFPAPNAKASYRCMWKRGENTSSAQGNSPRVSNFKEKDVPNEPSFSNSVNTGGATAREAR